MKTQWIIKSFAKCVSWDRIENVESVLIVILCLWSIVSRWLWTPWCLCAASCVPCPAQQQRGSALLCHQSLSKFRSLAPLSATPWWREQLRISTKPWSKKAGGKVQLGDKLDLRSRLTFSCLLFLFFSLFLSGRWSCQWCPIWPTPSWIRFYKSSTPPIKPWYW